MTKQKIIWSIVTAVVLGGAALLFDTEQGQEIFNLWLSASESAQ